MKMIEFTKQRKDKRPTATNISNQNRQKYRNADKVAEEDDRKASEWLLSFKELKLTNTEPIQMKAPKELQYLFRNENNKHDEDDYSYSVHDKYRHDLSSGLNMDLPYMKNLTSH